MALIDSTYFINDIQLATNEYQSLDSAIARYQKEYLEKVLGYSMAKDVLDYDSEASSQAVIDLVEGKEYVKNGYTLKWNGLINDDKVSAIAYYIYCRILEERAQTNTPIGAIETKHENAIKADEGYRYVNAWNKCVELTGKVRNAWDVPSMFNFLIEFSEDYPTCLFRELEYKNHLGI